MSLHYPIPNFQRASILVRVVDLLDCLYWRDTKHGENTSTKETLSQLEVVPCGNRKSALSGNAQMKSVYGAYVVSLRLLSTTKSFCR